LCEVVTTVFAMPVGRPRSSRCLRVVLLGPIEGNRGGILMQPWRREGIDFQGFEGDRTKHRVEIGRKEGIEDIPTTLLHELSHEGVFSGARDRPGADAVACLPHTVGSHPPGRP